MPGGNFILKNTEAWPVGIEEFPSAKIKFYPNPVKNTLFLSERNPDVEQVSIFDFSGKLIYQSPYKNEGIDIQALPEGIYLLELLHEGKTIKQKFLKN